MRRSGVDMAAVVVGGAVSEAYFGVCTYVCLRVRYRFVIVMAVRAVIIKTAFNM